MSDSKGVPSKDDYDQKTRSSVKMIFSFDDPSNPDQEPPVSAQVIERFEEKINIQLDKGQLFGAACTTAGCTAGTNDVKGLFKDLTSISLRCTSKCQWVKRGNRWEKVCTFECKGGGITMVGTLS